MLFTNTLNILQLLNLGAEPDPSDKIPLIIFQLLIAIYTGIPLILAVIFFKQKVVRVLSFMVTNTTYSFS